MQDCPWVQTLEHGGKMAKLLAPNQEQRGGREGGEGRRRGRETSAERGREREREGKRARQTSGAG